MLRNNLLSSLRRDENQLSGEGIREFLELIGNAAILIEANRFTIINANTKSLAILGYSVEELKKISLNKLCGDQLYGLIQNGNSQEAELMFRTRNGNSVLALATSKLIQNYPNPIHLVQFVQLSEFRKSQSETSFREKFAIALKSSLAIIRVGKKENFLSHTLPVWAEALSIDDLAVFIRTPGKTEFLLAHAYGNADSFEKIIKIREISSFEESFVWFPGKRKSPLMQIVLTNPRQHLGVVITIIGQITNPIGFLVAAMRESEFHQNVEKALVTYAELAHIKFNHDDDIAFSLTQITDTKTQYQLLMEIFNRTKDCIILADNELNTIQLNRSAEITLGYASEDVIGEQIDNILITNIALNELLLAIQKKQLSEQIGNITIHKRQGGSFLANMECVCLNPHDGINQIAILFTDLSETEQLTAKSRQLEQKALLGEVIMAFSHDARNPIHNIRAGIQVMKLDLPSDSMLLNHLSRINDECDRLMNLVNYGLSASPQGHYEFQELNISNFLQKIMTKWTAAFKAADITPRFATNSENPIIMGDKNALERVFSNLIDNAVNAMGNNGGVISVMIDEEFDSSGIENIEIKISDNGPGIPADVQKSIFLPFYTTNQNGTGLGLPIAKRIISVHKGTINFESYPGGTVFSIKIPKYIKEHTNEF